jgi:hypothetical protein
MTLEEQHVQKSAQRKVKKKKKILPVMGQVCSQVKEKAATPVGPPKGQWTTENLDCFHDSTDCIGCCFPAWIAAETRAELDGRGAGGLGDRSVDYDL